MNWQRVTLGQANKYLPKPVWVVWRTAKVAELGVVYSYPLFKIGEKDKQPLVIHDCKHYYQELFIAELEEEDGDLYHKDCETNWGDIRPFLKLVAKFEEVKKCN